MSANHPPNPAVASLANEIVTTVKGLRNGKRGHQANARLERAIEELSETRCTSLADVAATLDAFDRYVDLRWDCDPDSPPRRLLRSAVDFFRADPNLLLPVLPLVSLLFAATEFFLDVGLLRTLLAIA